MDATVLRTVILGEHAAIRAELRELDLLAERVSAGRGDVGCLRTRGRLLQRRIAAHLDFEDRHLPSAAGVTDEEARQISREHDEQRELLAYVGGQLEDADRVPQLLGNTLRSLVTALLEDMRQEERAVSSWSSSSAP